MIIISDIQNCQKEITTSRSCVHSLHSEGERETKGEEKGKRREELEEAIKLHSNTLYLKSITCFSVGPSLYKFIIFPYFLEIFPGHQKFDVIFLQLSLVYYRVSDKTSRTSFKH